MAWRRTVLTITIVALLAGRLAVRESGAAGQLLALAAVLAGWLAVLAVSWRRIVAMGAATPAPVRRAVPLTTLAALGFAGLGVVLVLGR